MKKHNLKKDLRLIVYGFGGPVDCRMDTLQAFEGCIINYLTDLLQKVRRLVPNQRLKTRNLLAVLKRDRKKYFRAKELLYMNKELSNARKMFDPKEIDKE